MSTSGESDSIGVVVPTLNCRAFLADTLTSLGRIPQVSRIIVADSGSTDGTLDIAASANVELLRDAPPGLYPAINCGLRRLSTPWLTYINGDDLLHPAGIAALFLNRAGHDVLYGPVDFINDSGVFMHNWHSASPRDVLPLYRAGISPVLQQGTLFRRTLFESLGGFRESWRFVSDADFWWRAAEEGARFHRSVAPPVGSFRIHGGQLSQRHRALMLQEHHEMSKTHNAPASRLGALWARARYRAPRWRSYLVRYLRQAELHGHCRMTGTYGF